MASQWLMCDFVPYISAIFREFCRTLIFPPPKTFKMKAKSSFNNKKTKNTDILSAGSKVYAKKRKAKKETVESVDFDDASRT